MTFGWAFWVLIAAGAACGVLYGVRYLRAPPSLLRAAVKTGAVGFWAAAFATTGRPSPLVLALAFSALGDLALAFDKKWTLGLGIFFFLIAQLLYLLSFFALWIMAGGDHFPLWVCAALSGIMALAAGAYLLWLAPKLGWLALGVAPYALAISAMTAMSFWIDARAWPAMIGAVLFMISDGVLAYGLFRLTPDHPHHAWTSPVVWWTYVAAQALIPLGLVMAVQYLA